MRSDFQAPVHGQIWLFGAEILHKPIPRIVFISLAKRCWLAFFTMSARRRARCRLGRDREERRIGSSHEKVQIARSRSRHLYRKHFLHVQTDRSNKRDTSYLFLTAFNYSNENIRMREEIATLKDTQTSQECGRRLRHRKKFFGDSSSFRTQSFRGERRFLEHCRPASIAGLRLKHKNAGNHIYRPHVEPRCQLALRARHFQYRWSWRNSADEDKLGKSGREHHWRLLDRRWQHISIWRLERFHQRGQMLYGLSGGPQCLRTPKKQQSNDEQQQQPNVFAAREVKGILDVPSEDEDYEAIVRNAERNLERLASPAMPCTTSQLTTPCTECGRRPHAESGGQNSRVCRRPNTWIHTRTTSQSEDIIRCITTGRFACRDQFRRRWRKNFDGQEVAQAQ